MKSNRPHLLKVFVALVLLSISSSVFSAGRAWACDLPVAATVSRGEAVCGENEVRLTGRLTSLQDGSLLLQTEAKGQADGPAYVLRFADDSLNALVRGLLEQGGDNSTPLSVIGTIESDSTLLVTAVVSGRKSGVSIGSQ